MSRGDGYLCNRCHAHHDPAAPPFLPGDRVRVLPGTYAPGDKNHFAGVVGIVQEWQTYNGPMWVRIDFTPDNAAHEKIRETYRPCDLELVTRAVDRKPGPKFERGAPTHYDDRRAIDEVLSVLAEEAAEVVQRVTKIQRFDFTANPWTGVHNRDALESEIGDVLAAMALLVDYGVVSPQRVARAANAKLAQLCVPDGRLRHASAEGVELVGLTIRTPGPGQK